MIGPKFFGFLLLITFVISLSSSAYIPTKYEEHLIANIVGYRLPNNTAPILYTLNLEPHIDDKEFTFDGTSSTLFQVRDPTQSITLHASLLIEIDKSYTTLIHSNGTIERPESQRFNSDLQFFNIRFSHVLEIGNYTVKMKWKGHDPPNLRGFYRGEDRNEQGETSYMVATHFQPRAARAAFPCWDEPGFKAVFEISLKHYSNYTALSNMPVLEEKSTEDGKVWTTFERTPVMSTYLATFLVAPYVSGANMHRNITFWVPPDLLKSARFSLEISHKIVKALEEYTGIPYNLPKLDAVLIPQYSSSATEHWGLISYTKIILFDEEISQFRMIKIAALLAGHEITHQWLGNLVTPAWWGDLWLSEAFAVYIGAKMIDNAIPGFHAMELFTVETVNEVSFKAEGWFGPPRPIKWMPDSPEEVSQMFGPVTYRKGAAVIRMLEHMMTEQGFQNGIKKYLYKHQYGSVVTDDLWRSLQDGYDEEHISPHLDIKAIMDPWVEQTGYPILNVTRDYETGFITITQQNALEPKKDHFWTIPINYATTSRPDFSSTRPTHFMRRANESLILYGIDKNDWIIMNIQQTGFYRVRYDWENWKRIAAYLNTENYHKIHVLNRAQLLYDVVNQAVDGVHYYDLLLDMAAYLHREKNYLPWVVMDKLMDRFTMYLMNTPSFDLYRRFMLHLLNNIVDHIGFNNRPEKDDYLDHLARIELLPWACAFGHEGCKAVAPIKLREILDGKMKKQLGDDDRSWIYCTALTSANETLWDRVMDAHSANPRELRAYKYLGCTKNHTLINKYITRAFANNATVMNDDVYDAFESMIMGPAENYNFALDYFAENIDKIRQYFNKKPSTIAVWNLCHKFASVTKTLSQYEKIAKFINKQIDDGKMSDGQQLIETARDSMRWSEKVSAHFTSMMEKKPYLVNFIHN